MPAEHPGIELDLAARPNGKPDLEERMQLRSKQAEHQIPTWFVLSSVIQTRLAIWGCEVISFSI